MITDVACHYTHGGDVADVEWVMTVMIGQKPLEMTMLPLLKLDKSKITIIPPFSSLFSFTAVSLSSSFYLLHFLQEALKNGVPMGKQNQVQVGHY